MSRALGDQTQAANTAHVIAVAAVVVAVVVVVVCAAHITAVVVVVVGVDLTVIFCRCRCCCRRLSILCSNHTWVFLLSLSVFITLPSFFDAFFVVVQLAFLFK